MNNIPRGRPLKTVETTLDIVDTLQREDGLELAEIAEEIGIAQSTAHGHLSTLENHGYIVNENGTFYLGLQFLNRGGYVSNRKQAYKLAESKVEQLAELTDERVQFIVEEYGRGTYIHTAIGNNAVKTDARIGKRIYLHDSAAGKSILAHLPDSRAEWILDRWGLPELSENTITDRDEFMTELESIAARGYAFNREESVAGLRAVGAPVRTSSGEVVGAFSVSGPTHRMKADWFEQEIPDLLLGVANELELNIEYQT